MQRNVSQQTDSATRARRLHLFEWEDQPWLPRALRDFMTHHLQYTFSHPKAGALREAIVDILAPPLQRSGESSIVDVCSGGGGPLISALPHLSKRLGTQVTATLTDLFPNESAFREIARTTQGAVTGELRPVSAFDVPAELGGFETVFTALHHFRPDDAKRVLADAVAKGRTIAVIEPFNRKSVVLTGMGGVAIGLLRTPFMGRMTLARFLWTYPVPVAPLMFGWDGLISCLRAYSSEEMLAMGRAAGPDYHWTVGEREVALGWASLTLTFMIGEPSR